MVYGFGFWVLSIYLLSSSFLRPLHAITTTFVLYLSSPRPLSPSYIPFPFRSLAFSQYPLCPIHVLFSPSFFFFWIPFSFPRFVLPTHHPHSHTCICTSSTSQSQSPFHFLFSSGYLCILYLFTQALILMFLRSQPDVLLTHMLCSNDILLLQLIDHIFQLSDVQILLKRGSAQGQPDTTRRTKDKGEIFP